MKSDLVNKEMKKLTTILQEHFRELKKAASDPILMTYKENLMEIDLEDNYFEDITFIEKVIDAKLYHYVDALLFSMKQKDFLAISRMIRAYIEHFASLSYLIVKASKAFDMINAQSKKQNVYKMFKVNYENLYYNSTIIPRFHKEKPKFTIKIDHLIQSYNQLSTHDIEGYYDYLCDFTHPYYGSNLIVFNDELFGYDFEQSDAEIEESILQIFTILENVLKEYPKIKTEFQDVKDQIAG